MANYVCPHCGHAHFHSSNDYGKRILMDGPVDGAVFGGSEKIRCYACNWETTVDQASQTGDIVHSDGMTGSYDSLDPNTMLTLTLLVNQLQVLVATTERHLKFDPEGTFRNLVRTFGHDRVDTAIMVMGYGAYLRNPSIDYPFESMRDAVVKAMKRETPFQHFMEAVFGSTEQKIPMYSKSLNLAYIRIVDQWFAMGYHRPQTCEKE